MGPRMKKIAKTSRKTATLTPSTLSPDAMRPVTGGDASFGRQFAQGLSEGAVGVVPLQSKTIFHDDWAPTI
jgi:hypothetical protein